MFCMRFKKLFKFDRYSVIGIVFGTIGGIFGALTVRLFMYV